MSTTAAKTNAPPATARETKPETAVVKPLTDARDKDRDDDEANYKPISGAMVLRLLGWLKPYRKLYFWGVVCGIIVVGLDLSMPSMQQAIVDEAVSTTGTTTRIMELSAIWIGLWALLLLFDVWQIGLTRHCGESVINDLRRAVFSQLQRLSMSFYDRTKLGRIITRGTSDMDALREPVITGINTTALSVLKMSGAAVLMLLTDWRLFLALCWMGPLLAWGNHVFRRKIAAQHQKTRAAYSRVSSNLAENIVGARVVSAFNRQDENLEKFNELQDENTRNNIRGAHLNGLYQPMLEAIRFGGHVIILVYSGVLVLRGDFTPGQLFKVLYYWEQYMGPAIGMSQFYNTLMGAMASCERIFGLLDLKPDIQNRPNAKPVERLMGHVVFEDVTFGYNPERPVLHNIKLDISAGKTFALVGATGSGKSSTVSLLARFYEFQQGRIVVDGRDIRDVTLESLHKQMGLVLQTNYLFTGTVMENIRYPCPSATDEEVYEAARSLGLHETFLGLSEGYKTKVGERGASVSLGIRQLICFTRILLANPSIFLLDEATSSIDTVTEMKIQTSLEKLVKGRTTIIVAHRLSTIIKADCIVVLEQGKIIERGTHNELLAANGHYANLYRRFTAHHTPLAPVPEAT